MDQGLIVGRQGNGILEILNGGQVRNLQGSIGSHPGSAGSITITGNGSKWTNRSFLYLGSSGNGSLPILEGGQAACFGKVTMGYSDGSNGYAKIDGINSSWTINQELMVGLKGVMDITNGGYVQSDASVLIGKSVS